MSKVIKFFTTVRNNWKKSTFAACLLSYGVKYGKDSYDTHQLMRHYCEIASQYGEVSHPVPKPFRKITVLLNPAASKRKAKNLFEKYCAPLFYLSGISVTVVQTEYAGQAKDVLETLDPKTDAVIIAGGDGTLSETVTGLLRRANDDIDIVKKLPIGVLPLGQTNLLARALLSEKEQVQTLIDATMAVIDGELFLADAIKIQPVTDDTETPSKPVYSLAQVEWGSFRDARSNRDKFWYFGPLRQYASYLFSSPEIFRWSLSYTEPCGGCSKCYVKKIEKSNRRWWHVFLPKKTPNVPNIDYSKIQNDNCGEFRTRDFNAVEFQISTTTITNNSDDDLPPHLKVFLGPSQISWMDFVSEGWSRVWSNTKAAPIEEIPVKELLLKPVNSIGESWLSIDSEDFEVKPIKVSILPNTVSLFKPKTVSS